MEATETVQEPGVALQNAEAQLPRIANPAAPPDVRSFRVYYFQSAYFVPSSKGGWYAANEKATKQYIIETHGIRGAKIRREDPMSPIDRVMIAIRDLNNVSGVGSCGGAPPQLMSANGKDILILDGPKLIEPVKGDFPTIHFILLNLLGAEQLEFFNGWLKWGLEDLLKVYHKGKQPRPGQFVAFVGPRGCGKNLVQERIITPVLGGRVAKPTNFFKDRTNFNGDLVGAEHWMLSDETPARDITSRREFGNHIKGVAANAEVRAEVKFGNPIVLRPFRRGTVSLNDEDENIKTLPEMDESIGDKLMLFRCNFVKLPFPSGEAIESAIASELPAYVHYLLHEHEISAELKDDRFGIKAYHHLTVLEALEATSQERHFLEEIDRAEPFTDEEDGRWFWEGKAVDAQQLFEDLYDRPGYAHRMSLESLVKYRHKFATYLSNLAKKMPERVRKRRGDTSSVYRIYAPVGWTPKRIEEDPVTKERIGINAVTSFKAEPKAA